MSEWTYEVKTGKLYGPDGEYVASGYSGMGAAKNNPLMEQAVGQGPTPRGTYTIGPARTSPNTGPITMNLDPQEGTNVFGRSLFRIHGDSIQHPGDASHGCLILNRTVRQEIAASTVRDLHVI